MLFGEALFDSALFGTIFADRVTDNIVSTNVSYSVFTVCLVAVVQKQDHNHNFVKP